jgi:hypothetical protein
MPPGEELSRILISARFQRLGGLQFGVKDIALLDQFPPGVDWVRGFAARQRWGHGLDKSSLCLLFVGV